MAYCSFSFQICSAEPRARSELCHIDDFYGKNLPGLTVNALPNDAEWSLADNLAELVNIVEENLVVRHSDDEEEVEGVDRARNLSEDASQIRECVIIRSACKYAPFSVAPAVVSRPMSSSLSLSLSLYSYLCRAEYARRERSHVSRIHGRIAVAPSLSLYLARLPPVSCLYAHVTHICTHTQSWIMHPCVSTPTDRRRTDTPLADHEPTPYITIGCDRESYVRRNSVRSDTISGATDTASSPRSRHAESARSLARHAGKISAHRKTDGV